MDIISLNEAKKAIRKIQQIEKDLGGFKYHIGPNPPENPTDGIWWFDTREGFPKYFKNGMWINPHAYL
ncbi:MAG: hypothetical protein N2043_02130 [Ignavibacterium sp.]|nr:hypothetical protein [Ignavibacterium sp.]